MDQPPAIQDHYPEEVSHCYGCGRLNDSGHQIKTRPFEAGTLTEFTPEPFHIGVPGFSYGGVIASIIDCHSTGSAAILAMQARDMIVGVDEALRFVTAHLEVDYLAPTPLAQMRLIGTAPEIKGRKVIVDTELSVSGQVTAKGHAVLVEMPEGPPGVAGSRIG
jgi:acyl-coenzyme A thioesterase PaaI-like protein